jgi:phosphoglycolate phosphatase
MHTSIATRPHAVIFDLDGTLLDSIHDIAFCANAVLSELGLPPHSVDDYKRLVGDGFLNLARKILPETHRSPEAISRYIDRYRELYRTRWNHSSYAYPGIAELLNELVQQNILLAVLSNKRDDFTKRCVEWYFPGVPFKEVRGERTGTPIKPDPTSALEIAQTLGVSPSACFFVGDSEIDINTAINAGMTAIGVLWGFRPRHILEEAGATRLISTPADLLAATHAASSPDPMQDKD